ncbi:MAG: insulinase family protein [Planctomycetes bacterium]|nr:insulinase family protein [Planctomycetota bacterium]
MTLHPRKIPAALVPMFTFIILLAAQSAAQAVPPTISRFKLDNGIRVVVLHVENSKYFAAFSYLPLGLACDGAGRTQWSHLLEHLTLRTTGPITDYRQRNAETMNDGMHLDFLGTTDNWQEGLDLHAKWLSGLAFSELALREEIPKALSEAAGTVANLYTHKWAAAAWNQVFRHGRADVAVLGDLRNAKLGDAQAYRDAHLVLLDRVVLCIIGGVPGDTLKPEIEKRFGAIRSAAKALPPATQQAAVGSELRATWDLDARHYMVFFPIPPADHQDYASLFIATMFLNSQFFMDAEIKELTGAVFCGVDLATPEGSYFYISASLKPSASLNSVKNRITFHMRKLSDDAALGPIPMWAMNLSIQLGTPADVGQALKIKPLHVTDAMMLGNLGLQWGLSDYRYGDHRAAMVAALKAVTASQVSAAAKKYLTNQKRTTLLLEPKK